MCVCVYVCVCIDIDIGIDIDIDTLLCSSDGKEICLQCRRPGLDSWVGKILWRRKWKPSPIFLPGESHGQRNLAGYSPWGHKEPDMTEQLTLHTHTHFSNLFIY